MGSMINAISESHRRNMGLRLLALAWALSAFCACGKPEPEVAAQGPAGKVEAVEGRVTAVRAAAGAQPREIAVAAEVFADDTVATAANAAVSIRLFHNLALWRLEAGQVKRVDQTAAWRASKQALPQGLAQQAESVATASAGRHSERQAAATAETAVRAPTQVAADQPKAAPAPAPSNTPAVTGAVPQREQALAVKAAPRTTADPKRAGPAGRAEPASRRTALGGDDDDLAQVKSAEIKDEFAKVEERQAAKKELAELDTPAPPKGNGGQPPSPAPAAIAVQLESQEVTAAEPQVKAAVVAALKAQRAALEQCQRNALKANGSLQSPLKVELTIGADGRVTAVAVVPAIQPLAACVQGRLQALSGLPLQSAKVSIVLVFVRL